MAREGHYRMYCSEACKSGAYRDRRREERQARQAEEEARRRRQERERQEEARRRRQERERQEEARRRRQERERQEEEGARSWREWGGGSATAEARRVLFELAGLTDDGRTTLKAAHRRALKQWHPDVCRSADSKRQYARLDRAVKTLEDAGLM
ncbi:J domain-containing protein [Streptomyces sp. NPDC001108]